MTPHELKLRALVGQRLDARFTLDELLHVNPLGGVYRATQAPMGRSVAVKLALRARLDDPRRVATMMDEAKFVAAMTHPSLVRLHEFGQDESLDAVYLVMEHVQGVSVRELLAEDHRLDVALALELIHQALGALIELHAAGLKHLRLTPEAMILCPMLDGSAQLKLLGLGSATLHPAREDHPRYKAPEQHACTQAADARADLYALGVILYEMLYGYPPFRSALTEQLIDEHLNQPAQPLSELLPSEALPDGVELLVMKLLAKDPRWRLDSALTARQRVEELIDTHRLPRIRLADGQGVARLRAWRLPSSPPAADAAQAASSQAEPPALPGRERPARQERKTSHMFVSAETLRAATPPPVKLTAQPPALAPPPRLQEDASAEPLPQLASPADEGLDSEGIVEPWSNPQEPLTGFAPSEQPATRDDEPVEQSAPPSFSAPQPAAQEEPQEEDEEEEDEEEEDEDEDPPKVIIDLGPLPTPAVTAQEDSFFDTSEEPAFDAAHIYIDEDPKSAPPARSLMIPVLIGLAVLICGGVALLVASDLGKEPAPRKRTDVGWSATAAATATKPSADADTGGLAPQQALPLSDDERAATDDPIKALATREDAAQDEGAAQDSETPASEATAQGDDKRAAPKAASKPKTAGKPDALDQQLAPSPSPSPSPSPALQVEPRADSPAAPPKEAPEPEATKKPAKAKPKPKPADPDEKLQKNLDWLKRR